MKFKDQGVFLATVNQWVRDGSNIIELSTGSMCEQVTLMGRDGCREELILFYDDEDYDNYQE